MQELFDEADSNSDGKLDVAEMQKNLAERAQWIKKEAASETMQVADDNKDGKVSLNEVLLPATHSNHIGVKALVVAQVIKNAGEYGAKTEGILAMNQAHL